MNLTQIFAQFDDVLSQMKEPIVSRKYKYTKNKSTIGLCADTPHNDIASISRFLTELVPDPCPPDMVEPMALILLLDQSSRHLRRSLITVDEGSIFAPTIAYAALYSRAQISSTVRYFDARGMDKDPASAPQLDTSIDVLLAFGRSSPLKQCLRSRAWAANGAIVRLDPQAQLEPIGPAKAKRASLALDNTHWVVDYWGERLV